MLNVRNIFAFVLIVISLVLLFPGLTSPMITITACLDIFGTSKELLNETRSIAQTIQTLYRSGNLFVAGLVLFFSVLVPFFKAVLLTGSIVLKGEKVKKSLHKFVLVISKWAMSDVFCVAVLLAYLSVKATDGMDGQLQSGFYWFSGYCLTSILAHQLLHIPERQQEPVVVFAEEVEAETVTL